MIILAILVFILILGLLIFVHELGHFVMAKRSGMRVEEFGFGFPPRMFGIRRGETIYSINWIPLGGFVKITGEDGHSDDPRAFVNNTFWARFRTLFAGVFMNFLLGWILLFIGFAFVGTPAEISPELRATGARIKDERLTIVAVEKNSPAEHAGFKHGDVILSIDGKSFDSIPALIEYSKTRAGTTLVYEIQRGKQIMKLDITPRTVVPEGSGPVGFAPEFIGKVTYPVPQSLVLASQSFITKSVTILVAFGKLVGDIFTTGRLTEGLSGPVGIAVLTRDFAVLGIAYLLQFTAVLSVNLGVINALPFPALDGGRMFFLLVEKIRGRRSHKTEQYANMIGFALLLLLMVAITYKDVGRFSEQFKRLFEKLF